MAQISSFKELVVFQKSYDMAINIFKITKTFPKEEKYSLTDQIRRSSRSIPANIAEAWAKRMYPKSFVFKLTDSLGEDFETEYWINLSKDCGYIEEVTCKKSLEELSEIRRILISIINNPGKFCKPRNNTV